MALDSPEWLRSISRFPSHGVFKYDGSVWATLIIVKVSLEIFEFQRLNPVEVKNSDGTSLTGVVAISAGSDHTVYLKGGKPSGLPFTGDNSRGQIGDSTCF